MKVLLLWSGGVESTSLLKWLLENTEYEVECHYIEFRNPEDRTDVELATLHYLRGELSKVRDFGMTFSQASILGGKAWPMDYVWQFTFGACAMYELGCKVMYRGRCYEDEWQRMTFDGAHVYQRRFPELGGMHAYKASILEHVLPRHMTPAQAAPWHKLYSKTKGWHLRHLGKLGALTWSCRRPIRIEQECSATGGGHYYVTDRIGTGCKWCGKPLFRKCGQCHTCKEIEAGLQGTSYIPEVARLIAAGEIE